MDKLYDLMTTGFKYQIVSCKSADELLQVNSKPKGMDKIASLSIYSPGKTMKFIFGFIVGSHTSKFMDVHETIINRDTNNKQRHENHRAMTLRINCLLIAGHNQPPDMHTVDGESRRDFTSRHGSIHGERTQNTKPYTPNNRSHTLNTKHSTLNIQHSTLNTQHSTLYTQHSTLNTQHSTLNTQH
jgi:hypothetical protein